MEAFIGPDDIPAAGSNITACGNAEAPIFAQGKVEYVAQPLGVIVATSPSAAAQAAKLVAVQYGHPKVRYLLRHGTLLRVAVVD